MRKRLTNYLVSVLALAMIVTSLPVNMLTAKAVEENVRAEETVSGADCDVVEENVPVYMTGEEELTGTVGDNDGFSWSFDESTATLTVTGEDSGLNNLSFMLPETINRNMKNVIFQDCVVTGRLSNIFFYTVGLKVVKFNNFDATNVTDMSGMFNGCGSLNSVDFSNIGTSSVTDMSNMFNGCSSLKSVDFSNFDTSNVTDMSNMFNGCSSLKSVDFGNIDTSSVTDMHGMFWGCSSLTSLDMSNFNTDNVTNMFAMFWECSNLVSVNVSSYDTSKVVDMSCMFGFCNSLESVDLSNFDMTKATEYFGMFEDCTKLNTIKTPKCMVTGQEISLPGLFADSKNNSVTNITPEHCNKILSKTEDYTITYNLNGGKNNANNPTSYNSKSATITLKAPTQKGYTFGGWYKESSYKTKVTKINAGSTGNIKLYAKWTPIKYAIKFDKNGATSGTMKNLANRKYDTSYKLTKNAYKRKGYTFKGWTVKKNGTGKLYKDKASVKNLTSTSGSTVTLYAQWKKETYKITYKLNGGTNKSSNPKKYDITTKTITLKAPTRKDYTFKGWYKDSKFKKQVKKITKGSTGNITLYAKWVEK